MDQRVLVFVALVCLSSPLYGRNWLGAEDNDFSFKPHYHHHHEGYGDHDSEYDSSEEDWDRNEDYTNYHKQEYGHHGYNHHVNHDHHYGSHGFHHHHHNPGYYHRNFGNFHIHGRQDSHEDHNHNNPELGANHNHGDRQNNQGQENPNVQNQGTSELPQYELDVRNNEPNGNPRAIDQNDGFPNTDSSNMGFSNVKHPISTTSNSASLGTSESGSPVAELPKSGLPNLNQGGRPQVSTGQGSAGDSDSVVFPDSPRTPITSSPLQPRILSTPEPITQAPLQNLTTQGPITKAPVEAPTTPALLEVVKCVRACPATSEYNPVCGSNNVTYNNPGLLQCARNCGVDVTVSRPAPCPRAIPMPLLKALAVTLNVTAEGRRSWTKRAAVSDPAKSADDFRTGRENIKQTKQIYSN